MWAQRGLPMPMWGPRGAGGHVEVGPSRLPLGAQKVAHVGPMLDQARFVVQCHVCGDGYFSISNIARWPEHVYSSLKRQ